MTPPKLIILRWFYSTRLHELSSYSIGQFRIVDSKLIQVHYSKNLELSQIFSYSWVLQAPARHFQLAVPGCKLPGETLPHCHKQKRKSHAVKNDTALM